MGQLGKGRQLHLLEFIPAEQLAAEEPTETDYIVEQLLVRGAITNFAAKIKGGKTTFIGSMLRAMFQGHEHMGLDTHCARVLYCTEEGRKSFRNFIKRTGLEETGGNLEVLFLGSVSRGLPWLDIVKEILAYATKVDAEVIIFDTLTRWARIPPDKENDAGTAATVMEPLEIIRAAGKAVLTVFHDRKSGGDLSDSARGSSAFGGAADILLGLTNPGTNGHPNRRHLSMVGRFDDPTEWIIDWNLETQLYICRNDDGSKAVERNHMRGYVELHLNNGPLSGPDLAQAMNTSIREQSFRRALNELVAEGKVARTGKGVNRNPYVYELTSTSAFSQGAK